MRFVLEPKVDDLAVRVLYKDGKLVQVTLYTLGTPGSGDLPK